MLRGLLNVISPRRTPTPTSMKGINLQLGWPSLSLFPKTNLSLVAEELFERQKDLSDEALIYGPDQGSEDVREHVANWLTSFYNPASGSIDSSRLFIGNGASATLGIILEKFTDPIYTRRVWMIEPTYFMACPIFEDAGFQGRLRGVPEDNEGIDIDFLRRNLEQVDDEAQDLSFTGLTRFKSGKRYPKLYRHVIYVVPTFSNPSGKIMSLRRRTQLVQLARQYDALVIADDVYDMLRWPTDLNATVDKLPSPPPRVVDVDRNLGGIDEYGNVCSNGSFSKIVAPGVRCSWVEGTAAFAFNLSTHGATKSGGCPSQMTSFLMSSMINSGFLNTTIHETLIPTYQKRHNVMMEAIKQCLEPLGVRITGGLPVLWNPDDNSPTQKHTSVATAQAGGFFCYIMFPDDLPLAEEIARIALSSYSLKIAYGRMMVVAGDKSSEERCSKTFGRGARLSWSWCDEAEIEEGVKRLATVIRDIRAGKVKSNAASGNNATLNFN